MDTSWFMPRRARMSGKGCERLFLRRARMAASEDCASMVDRRFGADLTDQPDFHFRRTLVSMRAASDHAPPLVSFHYPTRADPILEVEHCSAPCTLVSGILGHFSVFRISAKNQRLDSNQPFGLQSIPMNSPSFRGPAEGGMTLPNSLNTPTA